MYSYDNKDVNFPPSPPPVITPQYCPSLRYPPPRILYQVLFTYIYVWTTSGTSFWMYPVSFYNYILYGYIWDGERWIYDQIEYHKIDSIY